MRIVIDMQGAQTESRFRGIGRYTMSLTKALIKNKGEHEIILVLNGLFPHTIEPIRAEFNHFLPKENIRVWYAPSPIKESLTYNKWRQEVAGLIREAFISSLKPDIILVSSLFEGFIDDAVTSIKIFNKIIPTIVILYDLIPLLKPDIFLNENKLYKEHYMRKIEFLKRADAWLSISQSTAVEAEKSLSLPMEYLINISTACDTAFQKIIVDEKERKDLINMLGINKPFILYTGAAEARKNLSRLIKAYALMSQDLKNEYQLVLAGKFSDGDINLLRQIARPLLIKDDQLILTGYVSDEHLVKMYNLCHLFVLPSLHEGFGLPVLEAMSCGSVVIGSNCTSVPEVIGKDEALFDPLDETDISNKMVQALTDYKFRDRMIEHGKTQVKKFSWDITAHKALKVIEKTYQDKGKTLDRGFNIIQYKQLYKALIVQIASILQKADKIKDDYFKSIASCLEKNERNYLQTNLSNILEGTIKWRIEGPFDSSYSLALLNRETARALDKMGHEVTLHSTEGPGDFLPNKEFLSCNPDIEKYYIRSLDESHDDCDVVSRILYPPRVNDMSAPINLLHHYAWEESSFPLEWVDDFNKYLQGVTCLSNHVEKIMIDSGVNVPLSVTGCGVDHWERVIPDSIYKVNGKNYKFLHVSSCFPRKGADILLESYCKAFTSEDDVTLIIKTFPNPHNNIHKEFSLIKEKYKNYPDVVIINEDLPDSKLKALYQDCDVLVAPSKAEGFGLPLAEAMLSGLPVITTGWSGQLDFCNERTSWLVDYHFDYAKTHFNLFDSVWAEPDVNDLAVKMREVYELPSEKLLEKANNGRELLLKKFKWIDVAERLVESAKSFASLKEQPYLRIGWISTWNTRCGIAAYSENLINALGYPVTAILANRINRHNYADQPNVHRCWSENSQDSLAEVERLTVQLDLNTLVIQMNYYFFDFQYLAAFITKQHQEKRLIIIELHSTVDPVNDPSKKLLLLKDCLKKCHRVLVHSPNDMNRLKEIGVIDNVTLFPLGIADIEPSVVDLTIPSKRFVIASYGFFLPNKGLIELIEAVNNLLNEGYAIHLLLVNAQYPLPISEKLIKAAKQKIGLYNISDNVTLVTDYLKDEESIAYLNKADLVVFPYQKTGESSSAAVRGGLASKKPVAVTPLSIFDDISSAVFYLPGTSPTQIAQGIRSYIDRINCNDQALKDLQKSAEKWRSTHIFSGIGRRLQGMLISLYQQNIHNKILIIINGITITPYLLWKLL